MLYPGSFDIEIKMPETNLDSLTDTLWSSILIIADFYLPTCPTSSLATAFSADTNYSIMFRNYLLCDSFDIYYCQMPLYEAMLHTHIKEVGYIWFLVCLLCTCETTFVTSLQLIYVWYAGLTRLPVLHYTVVYIFWCFVIINTIRDYLKFK